MRSKLFRFQLKIERRWSGVAWFLFKFQLKMKMKENQSGAAWNRIWLISIQISIENERSFVWESPGQNLIYLESSFHWKWQAIGLGQHRTGSHQFLLKFQLKTKRNWSGAALDRIWLISVKVWIGNNWELVWGSPWQNLIDF